MIRTCRSLASDSDVVLPFTLGISLTVCSAHVCFGLTIIGVGFWRLAGGIALQARLLILIWSLEVMNSDVDRSSLESDSWTLSNVGFCSKSGKNKCIFAIVSSKICRSLTLITLFYFSVWTL